MKLPELNETELEVMKEIWRKQQLSAREVHTALAAQTQWSYSTTRTVLERMTKKGLLRKVNFHGLNLYEASISKVAGLARFVKQFATRVLEMEPAPVVALLAQSETLSDEEVADLSRLLDQVEDEL